MSVQPASPTLLAYDLQDTARNSRRGKPRGGFAPTHFDLYHTAADGDGEDVLEPMEGPPAHVRLPPVQFPTNDSPNYVPRRPSLASDPFLHAYPGPATSNNDGSGGGGEFGGNARQHGHGDPAALKQGDGRPPSPLGANGQRYPSGPNSAGASYDYGQAYHNGQAPPQHPMQSAPFVTHTNYRFGGPPVAPSTGQGHDGAPSYFDYSMRRHSLTNNAGSHPHPPSGRSPPRLPGIEQQQAHPAPPQPPTSSGGVKRKSSGEATILEDGQQHYQYPPPPHSGSHLSQGGPFPKRRGSSLTYDKLGNLSLSDQQRRDSVMSNGALSPWDDERRGSGGSWTSVGSQNYSMSNYGPPHSAGDPYDQRGPPPPHAVGQYSHGTHSRHVSDHSVMYDGSRGQMGPPPIQNTQPQDSNMAYGGRRPSIGIDQLVQGPNIGYGAPPPPPPGTQFRNLSQSGQGMLPTVAHSPPDDGNPSVPSPRSHHATAPPSSSGAGMFSSGPPVGPPAPWARGPMPGGGPPPVPRQHGSAGSVDSAMSYSGGQGSGLLKDSPYSRSPELRVTHKLAERKRRKEMSQLFDDLKDALPFDRGLKSSKWEILSKANEHIALLKMQNEELLRDNTALREHFGLGPNTALGAMSASGSTSGAGAGYDAAPRPPGSSHSQSSQASFGAGPPAHQMQQQHYAQQQQQISHQQQQLHHHHQQQQQQQYHSQPQAHVQQHPHPHPHPAHQQRHQQSLQHQPPLPTAPPSSQQHWPSQQQQPPSSAQQQQQQSQRTDTDASPPQPASKRITRSSSFRGGAAAATASTSTAENQDGAGGGAMEADVAEGDEPASSGDVEGNDAGADGPQRDDAVEGGEESEESDVKPNAS